MTTVRLLAAGGLVLTSAGLYLNLTSAGELWVRTTLGLVGAALLLTAGYQARRSIRGHGHR